jgi:hypothetical protein
VTHNPFLSCRKHQPSPSGFILRRMRNRSFVDATYQTTKSVRSQALSPTLSQRERELHFQTEFAKYEYQLVNRFNGLFAIPETVETVRSLIGVRGHRAEARC